MIDTFVLPASSGQQRIWFVEEITPGRATYNVPAAIRLRGTLDVSALLAAVNRVVARHEALRTTFDVVDGVPMQVVHPATATPIDIQDFSREADAQAAAMTALRAERHRPFDLHAGPLVRFTLFRIAADESVLLVAMHHIIADGWSIGVLFTELAEGYAAVREGREPVLPELAIQYADFAIWQAEQLSGDTLRELEDYWRRQLAAPLPLLELPLSAPRPVSYVEGPAGRHYFRVSADLAARLDAVARRARASSFMLYLAAFQLLLSRYAGSEDVVVGSPVSGRAGGGRDLEPLIGLFINMLALRLDLSGDPTFLELLGRARDMSLDAFAHETLPFERVVATVRPDRDAARTPVFQAVFAMQNAMSTVSAGGPRFKDLEVEQVGIGSEFTMFELGLTMAPEGAGYRASIEYDAALYDEPTIARFVGHFLMLLERAASSPELPVSSLDLLTEAERSQVLYEFNRSELTVPHGVTIPDLVTARAQRDPERVALVFEGDTLTRGALEAASNRFAARLRAAGVQRGALVAICADRSLEMIVALLGILKAGAALVGVDPDYPAARAAEMIDDSGAVLVLTQAALRDRVPDSGVAVMLIDDLLDTRHDADSETVGVRIAGPAPDDAAYVLYTSGSTGKPKGVVVPHRCLVNHVHWMQDAVPLSEDDSLVQRAPLAFDVSMWEVFGPLIFGVRLVLSRPGGHRDTPYTVELMARERITIIQSVPSLLHAMFDTPGIRDCTAVRALIIGGEAMTPDLIMRARDVMPWAAMYNGYGPTETTIDATWWEVPSGELPDVIPIGAPIGNGKAYVLSPAGHPLPIGVPGELYVGGAGVANGYLDRPELTAEKFVVDPFQDVQPPARMYRTGDKARWRPDGNLEYLGRLDDQIKLRGQRIELGEIEAAILRQPGITRAAVVIRSATSGDPQFAAFVVLADGVAVTPADLRGQLRQLLPIALVPSTIVIMDRLPLTVSGKVDRRALVVPAADPDAIPETYAAPRTPLEAEISQLWASLLGRKVVGVHDDFFDLGGHSLLAMQMIAQIERVWGRRLPLRFLLEHPTVAQVVALISRSLDEDESHGATILQRDGAGTPLAFVHGDLLGAGWYCRRLAPLLGPAPLIVLQTFGPGTHATIEAMAAAHLAALRQAQPSGPYRLGGFCQGGLVAFEMARQLSAIGERVESLILVDVMCANTRYRALLPMIRLLSRAPTESRALDRRVRIYVFLHYYAHRIREIRRMRLGEQVGWITGLVRRWVGSVVGRPVRDATAPAPVAPAYSDLAATAAYAAEMDRAAKYLFIRHAQRGYMPGQYDGRVDSIRSSEILAGRPWVQRGGGMDVVATDLHFHTVEQTHDGLIAPEGLPALAACIQTCLTHKQPQG